MDTPYEKLLESLAKAEVKFIVAGGLLVTKSLQSRGSALPNGSTISIV